MGSSKRKNNKVNKSRLNTKEESLRTSNNDMVDVFETYALPFDFTQEALIIEVSAYNKKISTSGHMMINSYGLIFKDYIEFCNKNHKRYRMEDFFKDSVENNNYLCDIYRELDFNTYATPICQDNFSKILIPS